MDEKVIVEVLADSKQVIVKLVNLLVLPQNLDILHLRFDQAIEAFDDLLFQLLCELIAREVPQSHKDQPQVHVCNRVVDVEVVLEVERVHKFPRVLVEHEAGDEGRCLHLRPLGTPLEHPHVLEPGYGSSELAYFHDVLEDWDQFDGLFQVESLEFGPYVAKVLRVDHSVVLLVLVPVQIRDGPFSLVLGKTLLFVGGHLLILLRQVLALNVLLNRPQLVAKVERFEPLVELSLNFVMLWLFEHGHDGAIHDLQLHGLLIHVLLVVLEVERVQELSVDVLIFVEPFQVLCIILILAEGQLLLIVDLGIAGTHIVHDANLGWDLAASCPSLGEEGADLGRIQIRIVIGRVPDPVHVEVGRVVEVVVEREAGLLQMAPSTTTRGSFICGCQHI